MSVGTNQAESGMVLDEDMSDLDNMLEIAVKRMDAVDALSKAKNTRLGAKVGSDEWRTANEYVRAWERKNEWHGVVYQARLVVEACTCGSVVETFEGFFSMLRHKTKSSVEHKRVRVEDVGHLDLTRIDRITERRHVNICIECWVTKGKQDAEKTGRASEAGFKDAHHVEGEDGHASVV